MSSDPERSAGEPAHLAHHDSRLRFCQRCQLPLQNFNFFFLSFFCFLCSRFFLCLARKLSIRIAFQDSLRNWETNYGTSIVFSKHHDTHGDRSRN